MPENQTPDEELTRSDRVAQAAHAAAAWWARAIIKPQHGYSNPKISAVTEDVYASVAPPSEANLKKFQELLVPYITRALVSGEGPVIIQVDFRPDMTLQLCLQAAGIHFSMGRLPMKTRMSVTQDSVTVFRREGAEGATTTVWGKE